MLFAMKEGSLPEPDLAGHDRAEINRLAQDADVADHRESITQAIRKHPKAVFWAFAVALTVIMEGYDSILLGNFFAYPTFVEKYGTYHANVQGDIARKYQVPARWQSGLGMAAGVGGFFGAFLNGYLVDKFGKKHVLLASLAALAGFVFIVFFAENLTTLLIGEIFCGFPWGIFATLSPAYASEVMPLSLRVYLTSYTQLCFAFGQLIAAGVVAGMVHVPGPWSYHGPFAIQWFWPAVLIPILFFAPDSPWDLVRHNRLDDARKALARLHTATAEEIEAMLALIIHTDNQERELRTVDTTYKQCFSGIDARRTEVACMSFIGQVTLGVCILGSTSYFFQQVGLTTTQVYSLNLGANGLGVMSMFLFWIFLLPRVGRRTIYIAAGVVIFVLLMLVGILETHSGSSSVGMGQACLMLIFTFVFQGTIAPLGWAIPAEIGSTRLRQKTVVLARNAYYITSTIGGVLNSYMLNPTAWNLRGYMTFFWAGTAFLQLIWAWFRLPESKGRSYEEMTLLFAKKVPARKFAQYQVDVFDVSEDEKGGIVTHVEEVA